MLKMGQNWGKIANYPPPPMLNQDRHPCAQKTAPLDTKIIISCVYSWLISICCRYYLSEENYFCSWATQKHVDHFYVKQFTEEDFTNIEKRILLSKDWGGEVSHFSVLSL